MSEMTPIQKAVSNVLDGYISAMARFDGDPCAYCGDAFDHTQSNYFPVWSDEVDNLICVSCYEAKEVATNA